MAKDASQLQPKHALLFSFILALQVVAATPAAAVTDLHRDVAVRPYNSVSPKTAVARCPSSNPRVIGGGGWAIGATDQIAERVMLTGLQPFRVTGRPGRFIAVGHEIGAGTDGEWQMEAYVICAAGLPGVEIVSNTTDPSSSTFKTAAARCPGAKKVLGTGARVPDAAGQVGLQLTRASGPRDISRAAAHEAANGYSDQWTLTSYAVCANPVGGPATAQLFDPPATLAYTGCPTGTFLHGPGGGGGLTGNGPRFLTSVYPYFDLRRVQVTMTSAPPGGMVAQAVCAPL